MRNNLTVLSPAGIMNTKVNNGYRQSAEKMLFKDSLKELAALDP